MTPRPFRPYLLALAICAFCAWAHVEWDWMVPAWALLGGFAVYDFPRRTR